MIKNLIINSDYYKHHHRKMYNPSVKNIFSYAESRGGLYDIGILFGLQGYCLDNLTNPLTKEDIDYGMDIVNTMGPKVDRAPWDALLKKHGGNLPIRIKAVPEGLKVPVKNALVTVEATDEEFFWLVPFIETDLIRLWYPTTMASKSYKMKTNLDIVMKNYAESGVEADFSLLDFGCRGVPTFENAAIGGAGFLTSFLGTDTIPAVSYLKEFYYAENSGFSVKATEHSVMCSYGKEHELESFKHLIENVAEEGETISIVSDTWDIYNACEFWNSLSETVVKKNLNLVIRPDSGDPLEVLPKMIRILKKGYSYKSNSKGAKVFDNVKLLWGDGVNENNYLDIAKCPLKEGFSPEILMLGSGGGLLQQVNRDTMKFAFKASAIYDGTKWIPISKQPITDAGKTSKRGRLSLIENKDGFYETVDESLQTILGTPVLRTVFENGEVKNTQTLEEIRNLIKE